MHFLAKLEQIGSVACNSTNISVSYMDIRNEDNLVNAMIQREALTFSIEEI